MLCVIYALYEYPSVYVLFVSCVPCVCMCVTWIGKAMRVARFGGSGRRGGRAPEDESVRCMITDGPVCTSGIEKLEAEMLCGFAALRVGLYRVILLLFQAHIYSEWWAREKDSSFGENDNYIFKVGGLVRLRWSIHSSCF